MKRVVITGMGILSSIGNNEKNILNCLFNGISGITFSKEMKNHKIRSHVWGNIKLNDYSFIDKKKIKFMNIASIYSYLAMKKAISDSSLSKKIYQKNPEVGIIVGSGLGSPTHLNAIFNKKKKILIDPYTISRIQSSSLSSCLSTFFKIQGTSYSISSACTTSAHCIGHAFELIQSGKQKIIFAGGGEEITLESSLLFNSLRILSTKFNNFPKKASRPYDVNRDGFVISGGSGIIIVEELEHAIYRKAKIYAEIVGYGTTSDGSNMFLPSGKGSIKSMMLAMKNIQKLDIDYINTHGTSTKIGDLKELKSIRKIFHYKNNSPFISSTKSITGHSLGVSGVHEIIYSILMLKYNFIAPSINIEDLDPLAKNLNITKNTIEKKMNMIMSNTLGFGGTNVSLIIKKYK
ncbi:3-oxoacyl-[acyl-carrier-protein] synthase 1 [Buchnera aphidicola (Anoecia corni)]|uniref:3-oxoacyl-[acyl-carrier-protein] synthase 1 n=1 Tax=Buchnera aphidicola (Anoecia corni) TaxID=2994477 RepID=A0AAT9IGS5_9GAMM